MVERTAQYNVRKYYEQKVDRTAYTHNEYTVPKCLGLKQSLNKL